MGTGGSFAPTYNESWALIVGIDEYQHARPLHHAVEDARAVRETLVESFSFPEENVTTLYNDEATRENILESFLQHGDSHVLADDRLVFFFAGHGDTRTGARGEIGFLIPHDGDTDQLSTLVRWDDLTKNAELVSAKHIFFIMDACYGGIAGLRSHSGSARFAKDMLRRYGRQVLTAGKADELVSDAGGPRPDHSVFTGHLLDALEGGAEDESGFVTATRVMSYVYQRVANDRDSHQTPHYGFLEGDGDFLFDLSPLDDLESEDEVDVDVMVESQPVESQPVEDLVDQTKAYLASSEHRIKLHDLVMEELRLLREEIDSTRFHTDEDISATAIAERLVAYEDATRRLQKVAILLGKWAGSDYRPLLEKLIRRACDRELARAGKKGWVALQRYPEMLLLYSAGVSAVAENNFRNLHVILGTEATVQTRRGRNQRPAGMILTHAAADMASADVFKQLPEYRKKFVPRSEYLFRRLQPSLEDMLFLGREYEANFDRFEILWALETARMGSRLGGSFWGPPGRFAWKHSRTLRSDDAFAQLREEADTAGENWPPLTAGLFEGSYDTFEQCWEDYHELIGNMRFF